MAGAEVAALADRIGSALTAATDQGIVHGRLAPESVLFDDAGAAYLSDFELGTGVEINVYEPERAAADLRAALSQSVA